MYVLKIFLEGKWVEVSKKGNFQHLARVADQCFSSARVEFDNEVVYANCEHAQFG